MYYTTLRYMLTVRQVTHTNTNQRYGQYLTHAHSHTSWAFRFFKDIPYYRKLTLDEINANCKNSR